LITADKGIDETDDSNPAVSIRRPDSEISRVLTRAFSDGARAVVGEALGEYLKRDGVERDGSPGRWYGQHEKFSAEEACARG
jgi:hypothetical protein